MTPVRKKLIGIICAVTAIILIPLAVYAVGKGTSPQATGGGFVQKTVDRVNFTVDKTEFVFGKTSDGVYNISFSFTAEKTEPDFYGRIDSLSFSGLDTEYVLMTASDGTSEYVPSAAILPASDGKTETLAWTVESPCKISGSGTFTAELTVEYTSGVTEDTADSHILKIPVTVTVK